MIQSDGRFISIADIYGCFSRSGCFMVGLVAYNQVVGSGHMIFHLGGASTFCESQVMGYPKLKISVVWF